MRYKLHHGISIHHAIGFRKVPFTYLFLFFIFYFQIKEEKEGCNGLIEVVRWKKIRSKFYQLKIKDAITKVKPESVSFLCKVFKIQS